jgi:hypothetical protein
MIKTMLTLYAYMDGPVIYILRKGMINIRMMSAKKNIYVETAADKVSLLTTDRLISLPSGCQAKIKATVTCKLTA